MWHNYLYFLSQSWIGGELQLDFSSVPCVLGVHEWVQISSNNFLLEIVLLTWMGWKDLLRFKVKYNNSPIFWKQVFRIIIALKSYNYMG